MTRREPKERLTPRSGGGDDAERQFVAGILPVFTRTEAATRRDGGFPPRYDLLPHLSLVGDEARYRAALAGGGGPVGRRYA